MIIKMYFRFHCVDELKREMFTNNNSNVNSSNVKRTKEREIWRELQILLRGYRHLGVSPLINI